MIELRRSRYSRAGSMACVRIDYCGCGADNGATMVNMDRAPAIARLLELSVRNAFAEAGADERRLTDWPVLRYLVQAGAGGRTHSGLQRFLGIEDDACAAVIDRLLVSGLVCEPADSELDITQAGRDVLGHDPSLRLAAAIATLTPDLQSSLVAGLEAVLASLSGSDTRKH